MSPQFPTFSEGLFDIVRQTLSLQSYLCASTFLATAVCTTFVLSRQSTQFTLKQINPEYSFSLSLSLSRSIYIFYYLQIYLFSVQLSTGIFICLAGAIFCRDVTFTDNFVSTSIKRPYIRTSSVCFRFKPVSLYGAFVYLSTPSCSMTFPCVSTQK